MKPVILYLCHRIPYPPNKGDKIASYHLLKYLAQYYDVCLGCFIDDPYDLQYRAKVKALCHETFFVRLHPQIAKIKALTALLGKDPMTLPYYYHPVMAAWVNDCLKHKPIEKALVFSSSMAQYLMDAPSTLHKVMHFVDLDSEKWRQYAEKKSGLASSLFHREYQTLAAFERQVCDTFNVSCFVTETEKNAFTAQIPPDRHSKIKTLENGIDSQYFSPKANFSHQTVHPITQDNYIIFTGAMDYWANVDAVRWFAREVWPTVLQHQPDSKFYIVGSSPTPQVKALTRLPGIIVTGRVRDVRPYLFHAKAAVAPMQIARGIQNKILEAMAMEKPVLTTSLGIEGLESYPRHEPGRHEPGQTPVQHSEHFMIWDTHPNGTDTPIVPGQTLLSALAPGVNLKGTDTFDDGRDLRGQTLYVADEAKIMADWVCRRLGEPARPATASRHWIEKHFSWEARLAPLLSYLEAQHG